MSLTGVDPLALVDPLAVHLQACCTQSRMQGGEAQLPCSVQGRTSMASSRDVMSQRKLELHTEQLTAPVVFSQSSWAVTLLALLQKGQLKAASSLGFCFLGGGLELFRLPMLPWVQGLLLPPADALRAVSQPGDAAPAHPLLGFSLTDCREAAGSLPLSSRSPWLAGEPRRSQGDSRQLHV